MGAAHNRLPDFLTSLRAARDYEIVAIKHEVQERMADDFDLKIDLDEVRIDVPSPPGYWQGVVALNQDPIKRTVYFVKYRDPCEHLQFVSAADSSMPISTKADLACEFDRQEAHNAF